MSKTILVLLDACGYEAATKNMGYFEQLKEQNACAKYRVIGQLPSSSRPMYQTLMTGLPSNLHGTVTNRCTGMGHSENLFALCLRNGLTTAAAAFSWFSELYQTGGPFRLTSQRYQFNCSSAIQNGIFYQSEQYPDSHIYADAEFLRTQFHPDFLLIHPMGIDFSGHQKGSDSELYQDMVMHNSELISELLPAWQADGYQIVVTADHGMDPLGMHGGNTSLQREIPLYLLSDQVLYGDFSDKPISQLSIAPLLCSLLGIPKGELMQQHEIQLL